MSVKNFLLLLLLCLSLRACNARGIGINHRKLEKKIQISNQNDQKGLSVTLPLKNDDYSGVATEERTVETQVETNTQKPNESKATATQKLTKDNKAKKSGAAVQKESLASISWHVPQNKLKEKYPSFNSDYSPPKTHPPIHN